MTETMVSRVRDAIHAAMDITDGLDGSAAERYAIAALKALKEPTDADLSRAGIENDDSGAPYCSDWALFRSQWNAMLDTALDQ